MPELATRAAPSSKEATGSRRAAIGAVGVGLPVRSVQSWEVAPAAGVSEEWVVARTGIRSRRVAAPEEGVADLAVAAARQSLAAARLDSADLDLVLVATMSHDQLSPACAPLVADRIGAHRAGAIDLNAACAGFVSALGFGSGQIESGRADRVLVIGAEVMSRLLDPTDRGTAPIFGDGAGAVVLEAADGGGVGPVVLGADGHRAGLISVPRDEAIIHMKGPDTFRQAVARLSESSLEAIELAGLSLGDVDAFVYHQANQRIIDAVGERLGLDPARVVSCIERYGNTSAATIPIAISEGIAAGQIAPRSRVLVSAFGGGLAWAASVVEWGLSREVSGDGA